MGVVENLDEGADLVAVGLLLLTHRLGDLAGVLVDAGDQSVAVSPISRSIIVVLQ